MDFCLSRWWRFVVLAVFLPLIVISAEAAQRGISVTLRQSESINAPILENRELYQESYALVIGIDGYSNGWPKLSNAIRDAEIIAEALENKGFEVELHRDPDADALPQIFKRFFILKGENPEARLFVWFAGHGATVDGEGYLIPADAPVISKGSEFKFSSVALRDFGTFMRQSASKHVYAVFDACFAGTVFTAQRAMPPAAITRATTLPVRQFLTSGDADQTVSDDGQFRELFVRAILGEEPADANGDGYLTASELGMYLGDRVTNLTESAQTPRYGKLRDKDYDRGDFVFVVDPEVKVVDSSAGSAEVVFWESVKDSADTELLLAYLSEYPEGSFANLARIKLTRFGAAAKAGVAKWVLTLAAGTREAAQSLWVREFPSSEANVLLEVQSGQTLELLGQINNSKPWYYVAIDGLPLGYVAQEDLAQNVEDALETQTADAESQVAFEQLNATQASVSDDASVTMRLSGALDDALTKLEAESIPATPAAEDKPPLSIGAASENDLEPLAAEAYDAGIESNIDAQTMRDASLLETSGDEVSSETTESFAETENATGSRGLGLTSVRDGGDAADDALSVEAGTSDATQAAKDHQSMATVTDGSRVHGDVSDKVMALNALPTENSASGVAGSSDSTTLAAATLGSALVEQEALNLEAQLKAETADRQNDDKLSQESGKDSRLVVGSSSGSASIESLTEDQRQLQVLAETRPEMQTTDDGLQSASGTAKVAPSQFIRRYITAAMGGNVGAQATLGYFYENGEHVAVDLKEAVRWYQEAAKNDHVRAILRLAQIAVESGDGPAGVEWYRRAATLGDADAQAMLGYFYQKGEHVIADPKAAIQWYLAAADQGNAAAQNNLGLVYQLGAGVPQDLDKAIYWYEQASANGSASAARNLEKLLP